MLIASPPRVPGMRFKINFTTTSGEQSFEVTGARIKDIKAEATARVTAAGGVDWSSERLSDRPPA